MEKDEKVKYNSMAHKTAFRLIEWNRFGTMNLLFAFSVCLCYSQSLKHFS